MILLSHILEEGTPLYGGGGALKLHRSRQMAEGDSSNNTDLAFPAHCGTHVDAPRHFDPAGRGLEEYPPEFWVCDHPFLLEKAAQPGEILRLERWLSPLESVPRQTDLLLIKTGFERFRKPSAAGQENPYIFSGPGFALEIGLWLRENRRLKMVGFDFISLTSYADRPLGRQAHRAFLSGRPEDGIGPEMGPPVLIVEDMKLSPLDHSPRKVVVAPLLYREADGAPATVLAEV